MAPLLFHAQDFFEAIEMNSRTDRKTSNRMRRYSQRTAQSTNNHRLLCAILRLFPGLFFSFFPPTFTPPLPLPPVRPTAPSSNFSVLARVFCLSLRPLPPKPNFASRPLRDILDFPFASGRAFFEGRSASASSTATSKASSPPVLSSSAPLCSTKPVQHP